MDINFLLFILSLGAMLSVMLLARVPKARIAVKRPEGTSTKRAPRLGARAR